MLYSVIKCVLSLVFYELIHPSIHLFIYFISFLRLLVCSFVYLLIQSKSNPSTYLPISPSLFLFFLSSSFLLPFFLLPPSLSLSFLLPPLIPPSHPLSSFWVSLLNIFFSLQRKISLRRSISSTKTRRQGSDLQPYYRDQ